MVATHSVARLSRAFFFIALCSFSVLGQASSDAREEIRRRVEAMASGFDVHAGSRRLTATGALRTFYQERDFTLAWFKHDRLAPEALELLQTIDSAGAEGLRPRDYHQQTLNQLMQALTLSASAQAKADLDLLLSDAFLVLGAHLLAGKVDPKTLSPLWTADRHGLEMAPLLAQAIETGSVAALLNTFRPSQAEYQRLRRERQHILRILEHRDWRNIESGPLIRPGMPDPRLALIRARLSALGDLVESQPASSTRASAYDTALLAAVSRFQARHGLEADGLIGVDTIKALNMPPQDRLLQVEVNMERWRWLPERLGETHIRVNTAGGELDLVNDDQIRFSSSVRLSAACHHRPVFSNSIEYLVLNPEWTIGPHDPNFGLLAELRSREGFADLGLELHQGWGADRTTESAQDTQWPVASDTGGSSRLVQRSGPQNALGQVKFMSSRGAGPLLHGAPDNGLLKSGSEAAFGCVQVEDAAELADGLLKQQRGWTRQQSRMADAVTAESETRYLEQPIPVHVQYLTTWSDTNGVVHFRQDVLNRDPAVAAALGAEAP